MSQSHWTVTFITSIEISRCIAGSCCRFYSSLSKVFSQEEEHQNDHGKSECVRPICKSVIVMRAFFLILYCTYHVGRFLLHQLTHDTKPMQFKMTSQPSISTQHAMVTRSFKNHPFITKGIRVRDPMRTVRLFASLVDI